MKEFIITVNGKSYEVQVEERGETTGVAPAPVARPAPIPNAPSAPKLSASTVGTAGKTVVRCPMPGTIMDIKVKVGDTVKAEAVLLTLEAMKMINEIKSPSDSVVASINVSKGATVNSNDILLTLN